ncbi:MAG: TonB family protein [Pseudomonadota bacterium]
MKRWLELVIFVTVAIALHVAFFATRPEEGAEAGGVGGEALISLQAAAPTVAEMVEAWERPTQVAPVLETAMDAPADPTPDAPTLPTLNLQQAPRAQMQMPVIDQAPPPDSVDVETTPAAPPPPEPEPDPEPEQIVEQPTEAAPDPAPTVRPKRRPERPPEPQTAQKSDVTSAGRAEQRAAGSGGSAQAGNTGTAQVATATQGQQQQLRAVWGAKIRAKLARQQRYPRRANRDGRTQIILNIARTGQILGTSIGRSSGVPELDQAALDAVRRARRFAKAPDDLAGNSFKFSLELEWRR